MMKRNILAVVIPALLVAGAANAAEIYNKTATNWTSMENGRASTSGPPMATPAATIPPMPVSA